MKRAAPRSPKKSVSFADESTSKKRKLNASDSKKLQPKPKETLEFDDVSTDDSSMDSESLEELRREALTDQFQGDVDVNDVLKQVEVGNVKTVSAAFEKLAECWLNNNGLVESKDKKEPREEAFIGLKKILLLLSDEEVQIVIEETKKGAVYGSIRPPRLGNSTLTDYSNSFRTLN